MCRCNVASKMFSTPVCNDQKKRKGALHVDVHLDVVMFTCVVRRLLVVCSCFEYINIYHVTSNIYVVQFMLRNRGQG